MKNLRNIFEWISIPFFAFMAIHMAGHGAFLALDHHHDHSSHAEVHEQNEELVHSEILETILS